MILTFSGNLNLAKNLKRKNLQRVELKWNQDFVNSFCLKLDLPQVDFETAKASDLILKTTKATDYLIMLSSAGKRALRKCSLKPELQKTETTLSALSVTCLKKGHNKKPRFGKFNSTTSGIEGIKCDCCERHLKPCYDWPTSTVRRNVLVYSANYHQLGLFILASVKSRRNISTI